MVSNEYKYKSDLLRDEYLDGDISLEQYKYHLKSLETHEYITAPTGTEKKLDEEIYQFEIQQWGIIQEKVNARTPEGKLYGEREKYYKLTVPLIISKYKDESRRNRDIHNRLQWCIIIGSALVTFATSATIFANIEAISFSLKIFSAFCSLSVTIAASSMGQFKYRERSNNLQKAVDDIENEYEAVKLGTGSYSEETREGALGIFADKILKRIKTQKDEQQILEQPPDVKQQPSTV